MNKDRLEMFSDGVFAIAITLLVLEIKIPTHEQLDQYHGLYHYLMHLWPSFLGFFIGFITIGIYWSNHHHLFLTIVRKTNHTFNLLNIFFLMSIAIMPFSVAILSDFITDPESISAAMLVFSISLILPQISLIAVFYYGRSITGIFNPAIDPAFLKKQVVKLLIATFFTGISIVLSVFYPMGALLLIALMFIMYFLPPDVPKYIGEKEVAE